MEAMDTATTEHPSPGPARTGPSRRRVVLALLGVAIVVMACVTLVAVAGSSDGPRYADRNPDAVVANSVPGGDPAAGSGTTAAGTPGAETVDGVGGRPSIIPDPTEGRAPSSPEEPGGWMQLSLFGVLALALAGIGYAMFRGGRTARANRAAWRAAAATGRDGAADTGRTSASQRVAEAARRGDRA
ncbi:hypothetical protein BH23ACT2_BH23ACT2_05820 [soil metagenome]